MERKRILVATDGSDQGNRAIDVAAELSAKLGEDLSIVHVLMHGRPAEEFERMAEVEHLLEDAGPHVEMSSVSVSSSIAKLLLEAETRGRSARLITLVGETILDTAVQRATKGGATGLLKHLADGDYADAIIDVAKADDARMIVIGCRGLGRVRGTFLGSVSQKVAHQAPCTVVIAR